MMITEKDTSLSEERAITEAITDITQLADNYFVDIQKSLNKTDSSESNIDNTGSNITHSFKNILFENHVSVGLIIGKKQIIESSISNRYKMKSSKR